MHELIQAQEDLHRTISDQLDHTIVLGGGEQGNGRIPLKKEGTIYTDTKGKKIRLETQKTHKKKTNKKQKTRPNRPIRCDMWIIIQMRY